jgi:uncharacterized membrane protein YjgN (DUF898 family)
MESVTVNVNTQQITGESYFDGNLRQIVAWYIIGSLITIATIGIFYPWSLCKIYGWKVNHTVICGKRLKFTGTGFSLFGLWIKWLLLSLITFGIYGFWISISLEKWKTKHTIMQ